MSKTPADQFFDDLFQKHTCKTHGAPSVRRDRHTIYFECGCTSGEYKGQLYGHQEAVKADDGKLPFDLIAWDAMQGLAAVLQFGAKKYAPRNWESGLNYSRVFAAAQRHMAAWFNGENKDPETGLSHIDHAMCCLMFLSAYEKRGQGGTCDDRPKLHKPMPLEGHHPGGC